MFWLYRDTCGCDNSSGIVGYAKLSRWRNGLKEENPAKDNQLAGMSVCCINGTWTALRILFGHEPYRNYQVKGSFPIEVADMVQEFSNITFEDEEDTGTDPNPESGSGFDFFSGSAADTKVAGEVRQIDNVARSKY